MKPHQTKTLRTRLDGSVTDAKDVRQYFATDGSAFSAMPAAVVYPRHSDDVQAAAAYAHEQAGAGKGFSLIGRGKGSNRSGGVLGNGAIVVFPAYMNRVTRLTKDTISVQPGVAVDAVQMVLHTQGRTLAAYSGEHYSSMGGVVATNKGGPRSLKYGTVATIVKRLKVVLDDGSIIETRRLSRREVERKKGVMTREGAIYRDIDGLLQDHSGLLKEAELDTKRNTAGYRLAAVRGSGGSMDLSQLFIGSQGTLGLITEITLDTARYESRTNLVTGYFDTIEAAGEAILRLLKLNPSRIEFIGNQLLDALYSYQPQLVSGLLPEKPPKLVVMVEFDNTSHLRQNIQGRRAEVFMRKYAKGHYSTTNRQEQSKLWSLGQAAMVILNGKQAPKRSVPVIDDVCVPAAK
ncbi:MAG TPA: FAD-binding oxidoreductase, partial [Candidatus Polarisedimenticolaceae bacterium]|nr:FAD-binding oxidoreductase [Candidatus Polarisedimenticolaceae bacterium]